MSIFDTLVESGVTQEDLEKAASARLFAEAAAAEGIDLSELTEDQAEELYDFWANGGEEYAEKAASAEDMLAEAAVKEAGAKLAEAEYIGRYMARVYADEMDKIAKKDSPRMDAFRAGLREGGGDIRSGAGSAAGSAGQYAGEKYDAGHKLLSRDSLGRGLERLKGMTGYSDIAEGVRKHRAGSKMHAELSKSIQEGGFKGKQKRELLKNLGEGLTANRAEALRHIGRGAPKAALTAGVVGGGAYAAHRAMKKESAFDTVVEQRAMEILEALQEPTFDEAVDEAALDLLRANGYDV